MSRIEEMIEEMCPDGVEYKKLKDVCTIRNGYTPSKKHSEYWENGTVPWFRMDDIRTHGRVLSDSLQHVTPQAVKGHLFQADSLIFATTATIGEHAIISVPFLCNQQFTVLTIRDEMKEALEPMYLFHYGYIIDEWCKRNTKSGTMAAVDMNKFREIEIPVPPLQVQEEIVRTLDAFTKLATELTTELAAELAMRTKQYAYYRDELLTGELMPDNVQYMSIGELIQFSSLRQKHISSQAPVYSVSNRLGLLPLSEYRMEGTSAHASKDTSEYYVVRKDWFAYRPAGLDVGTLGKMKGEIGLVSPAYKVFTVRDESIILPDYLALLFKTSLVKAGINRYVEVGARVRMDVDRWNRIYVPVPDIEAQKRAVAFLHDLESVCTDLTSGLPAEIEARNKQYAYYRDMMLDFPHMQS